MATLADMARLRAALQFNDTGRAPQPGAWHESGAVDADPWADMEMVRRGDPRWDTAGYEQQRQVNQDSGGGYMDTVRFVPRAGSLMADLANRGAITVGGLNSEGSVGNTAQTSGFGVDWDKMPQTAFGNARNVMPVEQHNVDNLRNRGMVSGDSNYGPITHRANWNSGWQGMVGPLLMAALTAGWGSLGGGGLGANLVRGARTLGQLGRGGRG